METDSNEEVTRLDQHSDEGGPDTGGHGLEADGTRHHIEQAAHLELLRCIITVDHRVAIQHRLATASAAFWGYREIFLSSVIQWRHKLQEYIKKIRPVALYGSAAWLWGADTSSSLLS